MRTRKERLRDAAALINIVSVRIEELERLLPRESCISRKRSMQSSLKFGREFSKMLKDNYKIMEKHV